MRYHPPTSSFRPVQSDGLMHGRKGTKQHTRGTQYQPHWQSGYQYSAMQQQVVYSHLRICITVLMHTSSVHQNFVQG